MHCGIIVYEEENPGMYFRGLIIFFHWLNRKLLSLKINRSLIYHLIMLKWGGMLPRLSVWINRQGDPGDCNPGEQIEHPLGPD
jgi:hypothetical protein